MDDISSANLAITLVILVLLSAFFSSSETGMMTLNRYRLKHLAKTGHRGAKNTQRLLDRLDRLIGVILIGNNFVNIAASSIATVLCIRLYGDAGIAIATGGLTLVVLIFGEVTPKTLAALWPERIAFPASYILSPLLKLLFPLVWAVNLITAGLMKLLGINQKDASQDHLSQEELRTIVNEAGAMIPKKHRDMLVSILDLENVTVNDIMVPRNEIVGIDLDDDIDSIVEQMRASQHTRLPIYRGDINNIAGILHLRNSSRLLQSTGYSPETLLELSRSPYFIPENTPLHTQLINFQKAKRRIGIVVDEYGDVLGIATLEDILEEIVGDFTTDYASNSPDILAQDDGTYIIDGSTHIRAINKALGISLSTDGPKTLNGLITEVLETIPETNVCLRTAGLRIEVLQIKDNVIRAAKIYPSGWPRRRNSR